MKAPKFWAGGQGRLLASLLSPLGILYGLATAFRLKFWKSWHCPVPVICVGNLVAGGAGKTPVVLDLAKRLQVRDVSAHIVTRGYGAREKGPLRVSSNRYDARLVGDEPLLLSNSAPTWLSDDRPSGCRRAMAEGAGLVLLDDGFQDPSCEKTFSLIVVDGSYGFGNGQLIPSGPLREPVATGLRRADAVVLIGDDKTHVESLVAGRLPLLKAHLVPGPEGAALDGKPVLPFAGIGNPEKFFDSVRACKANVVNCRSFPDHHNYSREEITGLIREAEQLGAALITTTKDMVRVPPDLRTSVDVLTASLVWENEEEINNLLEPSIANAF
jgi:tetraacyldisaccharide 4'-kinase